MSIRELKIQDAENMLEWMHDENVTEFMLADFKKMRLEDCIHFIEKANVDENNKHFAVCDDEDGYLGTISLKNINERDKSAEYAVIFRNKAIGTGVAQYATKEILRIAFEELDLHRIYLDVLCDNNRAIRFYEKVGFIKEGIWKEHFYLKGKYRDVLWLRMLKEEWYNNKH